MLFFSLSILYLAKKTLVCNIKMKYEEKGLESFYKPVYKRCAHGINFIKSKQITFDQSENKAFYKKYLWRKP